MEACLCADGPRCIFAPHEPCIKHFEDFQLLLAGSGSRPRFIFGRCSDFRLPMAVNGGGADNYSAHVDVYHKTREGLFAPVAPGPRSSSAGRIPLSFARHGAVNSFFDGRFCYERRPEVTSQ
jgi:hypothetical protein